MFCEDGALKIFVKFTGKYFCWPVRKYTGRGGEVPPLFPSFFRKLEKSALILEKNALIAVIYGLNFSFKVQFLRVSRTKKSEIFPWAFLFHVVDDCLSKCPNCKKTPLPQKIPGYVPGWSGSLTFYKETSAQVFFSVDLRSF